MAKLSKKNFLEFKDDQKFDQFLTMTKNTLSAKIEPEASEFSPLEEFSAPFIYYSPYPKGPPAASAERVSIKKQSYVEESEDEGIKGTPPLKKSLKKDLIDEKIEEVE